MAPMMEKYPSAFATALVGVDAMLDASKEVVIVGDAQSELAQNVVDFVRNSFLPNVVIAVGSTAGIDDEKAIAAFRGKVTQSTTVYVCEHGSCKLPTSDVKKAKELITDSKKYEL
jgi:uncharacterized protein YyaL (SSP411 family)